MNTELGLWIAAASGIFALVGALGSQLISALANLKSKRIELVYIRRLDAYKDLIGKVVLFEKDSKDHENYSHLLEEKYSHLFEAFLATIPIGSDAVIESLVGKKHGLIHIAKQITDTKDDVERSDLLDKYHEALEYLASAIRQDLRTFSGR